MHRWNRVEFPRGVRPHRHGVLAEFRRGFLLDLLQLLLQRFSVRIRLRPASLRLEKLALLKKLRGRNYLRIILAAKRDFRLVDEWLWLGGPHPWHVLQVHILRLVVLSLLVHALVEEKLLGAACRQNQLLLLDSLC